MSFSTSTSSTGPRPSSRTESTSRNSDGSNENLANIFDDKGVRRHTRRRTLQSTHEGSWPGSGYAHPEDGSTSCKPHRTVAYHRDADEASSGYTSSSASRGLDSVSNTLWDHKTPNAIQEPVFLSSARFSRTDVVDGAAQGDLERETQRSNAISSPIRSVKVSDSLSDTAVPAARVPFGAIADPRYAIIRMILNSPSNFVTISMIHDALSWEDVFEGTYGTVLEYLQSYHSIFVASPIDDRVALHRQLLMAPASRKLHQERSHSWPTRRMGANKVSSHIGSVSQSCVGESFDLEVLEVIYRRRGHDVVRLHEVLHVSSPHIFDLFLFPNGVVVWWGMHRHDHWMVDDDFLSPSSHVADAVHGRYEQRHIDDLFPIWGSYELSDLNDVFTSFSPTSTNANESHLHHNAKELEKFQQMLCFDHFLVPHAEPSRTHIMLTVSFCLGRSARVDYLESITQSSHKRVLSIPSELRGVVEYFWTRQRIARLQGELHHVQLAIITIRDTPAFLWEMPWLLPYFEATDENYSVKQRLAWFCSRSGALLEQLSDSKARQHRLFMLGSDVFLIVLLILDVIFMTTRLIVKLYF